MNESEPDRTENTAVSRSPWKSLAIVVLIANFLRALGLRVDDALAPGALALSGLGVVNLMSVFGALFMMSRL